MTIYFRYFGGLINSEFLKRTKPEKKREESEAFRKALGAVDVTL